MPLRMQLLQRLHSHFAALQGGNPFRRGTRGRKRGDGRNPCLHRGPPNRFFIKKRILPMRRIHDQLNALAL